MKEEISSWVKNLAVFYIIFTSVLQLIPDKKYERYVKNFMGLLFIYMICTAVFSFFGKSGQMITEFREAYNNETLKMNSQEKKSLQFFYLEQEYEKEIRGKILEILKSTGIKQADAAVHIEGENLSVDIYTDKEMTKEQEGRIRDGLWQNLGIGEEKYQIHTDGNGKTAVDTSDASGNSSDRGIAAGVTAR